MKSAAIIIPLRQPTAIKLYTDADNKHSYQRLNA